MAARDQMPRGPTVAPPITLTSSKHPVNLKRGRSMLMAARDQRPRGPQVPTAAPPIMLTSSERPVNLALVSPSTPFVSVTKWLPAATLLLKHTAGKV